LISLIWAQAANGVIGHEGALPWRLPEDLKLFRSLTVGATVLMGRATWDSLPDNFRPLPDRRNLVLTRQPDWAADGALRVASIGEAVSRASDDLWVIGGAQAYAAAMPAATQLVVTNLESDFEGDTHAPTIDAAWTLVGREPGTGWSQSTTGLRYRVTTYER
jgi:dihydrofolate reductase